MPGEYTGQRMSARGPALGDTTAAPRPGENTMNLAKLLMPIALTALVPHAALAVTGDKAEFKKVADDVYAFIGKRNDANALVVVTAQGAVLVDTGNNPPETRILQNFIRSVTDQPVRYVVITQNHGDHTGGAPLFAPPANVIVHDRVARDWASWKPYQIKSWRKRFRERADALKNVDPTDTVLSFKEGVTLHLGGKRIELIYVDDPYNPGDIAVWLPQSGVLHAGFVGYIGRHPDIRPDYSHGTTAGILKQLEVLVALRPKVMVPAHGPLGDAKDLHALADYLLLAREKVRAMTAKGLPLQAITREFQMNEYEGWDRENHFEWLAETVYRELRGEGPQIVPVSDREVKGTIVRAEDEGRRLLVKPNSGPDLRLRVTADTDIDGAATDRSRLKAGMKLSAKYLVPEGFNAALGYDVTELVVAP
ncbi:MAG: MBL fold metallo-hydrolase [Betaproteobacteria bacterium]|nr:MAG: MBL fold metallo-hydrolase [Betaproteobacteria bacterium]